ncbi:MAG: rRNA pseudouridine synthase [Clostridiales bacterium]|nr:rRNA pseudouridine synthase [Clostridiales bacterium]
MWNIIMPNKNEIRLQKYMAECAVASRRKSEELISAGKVKVNGHIAALGDKINPKKDIVTVRGKRINKETKMRYIILNKPRGYVTSVSDEFGRKTVMDLVKDIKERVYPVGRLDRDSEGLLLLTNDGSFANTIAHPGHNFSKVYRVTVHSSVDDSILYNLRNGVKIDGKTTLPCEVSIITADKERTVLEFIIKEGRNRQIRKMCSACGLDVARLKRTAVGALKLGMLPVGKYRELTDNELKKLLRSASPSEKSENSKELF